MNTNYTIHLLIKSAFDILKHGNIKPRSVATADANELIQQIEKISKYIVNDYPVIVNMFQSASKKMIHNGKISSYHYSELRTALHVLDMLYPEYTTKIFISHSSKDADIIRGFIDNILIKGCGFRPNEIFCTLDSTAIPTGRDFRQEIVHTLKKCDYIILMISQNYKESEVCLYEMGATWVLDRKSVMPFVLSDCTFKDMGFPYNVMQGASITDPMKLDEFYNEICSSYHIKPDWIHFNLIKNAFIAQYGNDK